MESMPNPSEPLINFSEEEIKNLVKSNDDLDQEEASIIKEKKEDAIRKELENNSGKIPFRRLRKSPIEVINRTLFFVFLGSFLFSFFSVYSINKSWFFIYIISAFSCVFYTPNRKALKELIAAWPNILDLMKKR